MSISKKPVVVVIGVAGSGKSTVGSALARHLGVEFADGDDFHPPANVAKMAAGQPLDDADRWPWLAAIGDWIDGRLAAGTGGVVACSGLHRAYRDRLRRSPDVRVVYLRISAAEATARAAHRTGHYFGADLVASQFATLEEPGPDEDVVTVDATASPADLVALIGKEISPPR
ncbi:gluconokinase [Allocatelliglobosispora scoriae]|uniref:Gluconokinase n=1 Tax=Allocatelliglobosispora scoriae TaxID=643052 RepID=A0A841BZ03_9ACTN|nr:gluconokinase [Allocatelliglobosispora scoriae]MBB5872905.1 gluconokinase [Allocatelliglobosispora scoriae]